MEKIQNTTERNIFGGMTRGWELCPHCTGTVLTYCHLLAIQGVISDIAGDHHQRGLYGRTLKLQVDCIERTVDRFDVDIKPVHPKRLFCILFTCTFLDNLIFNSSNQDDFGKWEEACTQGNSTQATKP